MRVLGIDPGSHITGYGIVDSDKGKLIHICDGSIVTGSKNHIALKLNSIFDAIHKVINEFKPDSVAVEDIFYAKNARSAIMLGHARGVAILSVAQHGLSVSAYSPMKIKQAVVGYGNATKEQVQKMVKALLKMNSIPRPDASDALAAAICHIHHNNNCKLQVASYKKQEIRSKKQEKNLAS
ncbi:MAG: crossover junction endodeoxyribonuclease RuvC [Deltaproteobacteria bacterium]|nr:crossover junction endodeoxyribonuclease RuvC [Deltaproteobacteria bacterium]